MQEEIKSIQYPYIEIITRSEDINNFININKINKTEETEKLIELNKELKIKAEIAQQRLDKFYRKTDFTEMKKAQAKIAAIDYEYENEINKIEIEAIDKIIRGETTKRMAEIWKLEKKLEAGSKKSKSYNKILEEQRLFLKTKLAPRTKSMIEAILETEDITLVSYEQILAAQIEIANISEDEIDPAVGIISQN